MRILPLATASLCCALVVPAAHAVGSRVDVQIVDRDTGTVLDAVRLRGDWWVAGRPGARYAVRLVNRGGRRTLGVLSVDGVNAISGDTAAWDQSGYVLDGYERTEIAGWRKTTAQVAAFEFAALPDSYAARTGRAAHVGVIGVALFDERARPQPPAIAQPSALPRAESAPAPSAARAADAAEARTAPAARERLGTGHGAIEESAIRLVGFERARPRPDEVVTIRYDSAENLIALGVLPRRVPAAGPAPDAFPASRGTPGFVPDPPIRP